MPSFPSVDIRKDVRSTDLTDVLHALSKPTLLKGLVAAWPAVERAKRAPEVFIEYLKPAMPANRSKPFVRRQVVMASIFMIRIQPALISSARPFP